MKIQKYSDIASCISDLDKLLIEQSIPINKIDRLHIMGRLIQDLNKVLNDSNKLNKFLKVHNQNGEVFYALVELSELKEIITFLRLWDKKIIKTKLSKILGGPILLKDEDKNSNEARNTMFELRTASTLQSKGYNAQLKEPNPDIEIDMDKFKVFIQCKRPFFEETIRQNVSSARKQLIEDIRQSSSPADGIIAISISRFFNKDKITNKLKLLESATEESARAFLFEVLRQFILQYEKYWKNISYKKIKAVLIHIACPIVILSKQMIYTGSFWTFNNIHNDGSFEEVAEYLNRLQELF